MRADTPPIQAGLGRIQPESCPIEASCSDRVSETLHRSAEPRQRGPYRIHHDANPFQVRLDAFPPRTNRIVCVLKLEHPDPRDVGSQNDQSPVDPSFCCLEL